MKEVKNLDDKRVCDITDDSKAAVIVRKGCVTKITANQDGTLSITQKRLNPEK